MPDNSVQVLPARELPTAIVPQVAADILAIIADAARDPQCDVAKMSALLEMKERMDDKDAVREFNRDFALAMMQMPKVAKRGKKGHEREGLHSLRDV